MQKRSAYNWRAGGKGRNKGMKGITSHSSLNHTPLASRAVHASDEDERDDAPKASSGMKVAELRNELMKLNQSVRGSKEELIQRIASVRASGAAVGAKQKREGSVLKEGAEPDGITVEAKIQKRAARKSRKIGRRLKRAARQTAKMASELEGKAEEEGSWKTHGPPTDGLHALLLAAGLSPSGKGHGQFCAQQLELASGSEGGQRGQQASSLPARLSVNGEVEDDDDKTMEGTSYAPSLFAAAAVGRWWTEIYIPP